MLKEFVAQLSDILLQVQLVIFIHNWEPNAPDREALAMAGNAVDGQVSFNSTCFACYGESDQGAE